MPEGGIPFGTYTLFRRMARGGMAEVFLARQKGLEGFDRRVAVKRILPHLSDSSEFVRMFLGEARLAARLAHPNIVHIYDFGKVSDDYFIAMEFVDGVHAGQLIKHAKGETLPPTLVARIGADAAAALHYAHSLTDVDGKPLRLVHRDVSPANLMVSFDGVVKLVDFGIAKAALLEQKTNPGTVKGKYAYMSPEQTTAGKLDGRSDVFSLGLVLWEMCTGRHIVERGNPVDAMRAIRDGKLPRLETVMPTVPPPLSRAIGYALETHRDERATAMELSQALEAYIKASPELATSVQLASWIRGRFQPTSTGQVPALDDAGVAGGGTRAATDSSGGNNQSIATPPVDTTDPSLVLQAPIPSNDGRPPTFGEGPSSTDPDLDPEHTTIDGGTVVGAKSVSVAPVAPVAPRIPPRPPGHAAKLPPPRPAIVPSPSAMRPRPPTPTDLDVQETIERAPPASARATQAKTAVVPSQLPPDQRPTVIGGTVTPTPVPVRDNDATMISVRLPITTGTAATEVGDSTTVIAAPAPSHADDLTVAAGSMEIATVIAERPPHRPSRPPQTLQTMPAQPQSTMPVERTAIRVGRLLPPIKIPRRAWLAAIAGGAFAAIIALIAILARGDDDDDSQADRARLALTIDAAPAPIDATVTAELRVVTIPPGALARVGDRRGQTPITFEIVPGPHAVVIELVDHVTVERAIDLRPGEHRTMDLAMERLPPPPPDAAPAVIPDRPPPDRPKRNKTGTLTIRTTPYSEVYLGARHLGQAPFAGVSVPVGTHLLTFKHPGRRTITRRVVIRDGKETKLRFALP